MRIYTTTDGKQFAISTSAVQRGFGTDWWKRVSFLTREEREYARAGGRVVFESARLSGGNYGTYWREAVESPGYGFQPRVPHNLIAALESGDYKDVSAQSS